MRKLLILVLAFSTFAWAHGAKKTDQSRAAGNDWYQATLNREIDHSVAVNKTTEAPSVAFSENPAGFQTPASMAARQGGQGSDWYDQRVKIANDVNLRDLHALKMAR